MHIILGALGTIVTILILLNRLSNSGIDIGWLNPFAWKRRREWAKKYHANPLYSLSEPMEVTALLMVALAKSEGEISREQKQEIKKKFGEVFHLSEEQAAALLASSVFLLKEDLHLVREMGKLLAASLNNFTEQQAVSALEMLTHLANFDSPANTFQQEVLKAFKAAFTSKYASANGWA